MDMEKRLAEMERRLLALERENRELRGEPEGGGELVSMRRQEEIREMVRRGPDYMKALAREDSRRRTEERRAARAAGKGRACR